MRGRPFKARIPILILMIIILSYASHSQLFNVSAQAPPYPPLKPSMFKVVRTSWISPNLTISAVPGDTNIPLYITVQNIGNRTATGLSQTLFLREPFTNISGGNIVKAFYESNVSPGLAATTKFVLNIARNASVGPHALKMRIDYLQIVSGVGATLYLEQQVEVEVPVLVTGTPLITIYSVNIYPMEAPPRGNVTISGTVVNTGTLTMSNTNVSLSSPAFIRGAFIFIGQADPDIPRPFSATLQVKRGLAEGVYPITLHVTYSDPYGVGHISSATSAVRVAQRTPATPGKPPTKTPIEIFYDILIRVLRFFFGAITGGPL
ncbi:MAG: hypothetical protein ACUVTM_00205 [Candidatus Bathyarchaeia archaeon]